MRDKLWMYICMYWMYIGQVNSKDEENVTILEKHHKPGKTPQSFIYIQNP